METSLAATIREKIASGLLPAHDPVKMRAGFGSGQRCSACDQTILKAQIEYAADYGDERPAVRFHVGCRGLWVAELRRRPRLRSD